MAEVQTTVPTALRVEHIEGKGRGLVAAQPLKGGQIIVQDSPTLVYSAFPLNQQPKGPSSSLSSFRYCAHCFKNLAISSTVVTCPSCSHPFDAAFCGSRCQSLSISSTHTQWVCQTLNYLRNCAPLNEQSEEYQVQARYLVAAYNLAMVSPSRFQTLLSLEGGQPVHDGVDAAAAVFLHSIISLLPFPLGFTVPALELTAALLVKDKHNAFGLMEPFLENKERTVRAYAIYPNISFFNHDCLPNACRFDYVDAAIDGNTDIIVRMIHDVPQGREICLSYFPVNLRYSERQKRLLDDYGFSCLCDRCKVEANWSDKEDDGEEGADEAMDDEYEGKQNMSGSDLEENEDMQNGNDDDFPHAYFFLKYMCNRESCGGTLAPIPPSGDGSTLNVMECNVCGTFKNEEEMERVHEHEQE